MSVYSSDAFVWEKEQAGRALGRLVSASRSQTNLSIGPSLSLQSVCLSVSKEGIYKYTAVGTAVCRSGGLGPTFKRKYVGRGG